METYLEEPRLLLEDWEAEQYRMWIGLWDDEIEVLKMQLKAQEQDPQTGALSSAPETRSSQERNALALDASALNADDKIQNQSKQDTNSNVRKALETPPRRGTAIRLMPVKQIQIRKDTNLEETFLQATNHLLTMRTTTVSSRRC